MPERRILFDPHDEIARLRSVIEDKDTQIAALHVALVGLPVQGGEAPIEPSEPPVETTPAPQEEHQNEP